ncbi:MAG: hypothetical protein WCO02_00635 [Bacteroidota bacterium]
MKKYLLLIAVLFVGSFSWAQSNKEEIDLMQAAFGKDKKSVVAEFVKVNDAQKAAFWKLYDEYETQRKALGRERIELLKQYADHYFDFTPVQADEWTKKVISLGKRTDDLIASYYGKVKAISDGIIATQFFQIENYILASIRMQILQNVPFIQKQTK